MILSYLKEKIKRFWGIIEEPSVYLTILIILVAFISFGLGRLSLIRKNKEEIKITAPETVLNTSERGTGQEASLGTTVQNQNSVFASKNGTKYYFSWCSGISRISEANKITFSSDKEAQQAGYTIAANCTAP